MLKRIASIALVMVFLIGSVGFVLAAGKVDGNARKGKYLFRKNCRACHQEGASAKDLSPADKTQDEWAAIFENDASQNLACKDEWDKAKEKDITDIYAYMYNHAFDSPSPAKCK